MMININAQIKVLDLLEHEIINVDEAIRLIKAISSNVKVPAYKKKTTESFIPPSLPTYFDGLETNNLN